MEGGDFFLHFFLFFIFLSGMFLVEDKSRPTCSEHETLFVFF